MENKENKDVKTENNTKEEKKTPRNQEDLAKIAISKEADQALMEILNRVESDFDAGKATKQDVASRMILGFAANCTERDIHAMRMEFFNPILVLEATLRKAKETGVLPEGFRDLLFQQSFANDSQPAAKRAKKSLNPDIIKDNVSVERKSA